MGSDRARNSYDANQHYRTVVAQQGRVTLEADWNEAQLLTSEEIRSEAIDLIGPRGTPDDGYRVLQTGETDTNFDFSIQAGTMYVGGVRATAGHDITYRNQTDWLDRDGDTVPPAPAATTELIFLHLQEQEVSAVEDSALREVALGGPDSTQRSRLIQRIMRIGIETKSCAKALEKARAFWRNQGLAFDTETMRLMSSATLKVNFTSPIAPADPCEPELRSGYLGAENQFIRVQISGFDSTTGKYTLIWGFDNASFIYRVNVTSGTTLRLLARPVDEFHCPSRTQIAEVLRSAARLSNGEYVASANGFVSGISTDYDRDTQEIGLTKELLEIYSNALATPRVFLRIWEGAIPFSPNSSITLGNTGLEVTVQITGDQPLHIGDYWQFAVRPKTPDEVYPKRYREAPQPPDGPRQWVCPLAVIEWKNQILSVLEDCRQVFDNLVELSKRQGTGCCTVFIQPGTVDIQHVLDQHKNRGPVTFCLTPGVYRIPRSLRLDSGHSKFTILGCEKGVILEPMEGSDKEFLHGLVVLVKADGVTLKRLQFNLPIVPFFASGGQFTGFDNQKMQELLVDGDTGVCIGIRALNCAQLTIEECELRFLPALTIGTLPTITRTLALADFFGAGIFASGDCMGLTVNHNRFLVGQTGDLSSTSAKIPLNLIGYALVPTVTVAPSNVRVIPTELLLGSPSVALSRLHDASFQQNKFSGLSLAALIYAETSAICISGNTIEKCCNGFWLLSLSTLKTLTKLTQEITGGSSSIAGNLAGPTSHVPTTSAATLATLVFLMQGSMVTTPLVVAASFYPLPSGVDLTVESNGVTVPMAPGGSESTPSLRDLTIACFSTTTLSHTGVPEIDLTTISNLSRTFFSGGARTPFGSFPTEHHLGDLGNSLTRTTSFQLSLDFSHNHMDPLPVPGSATGNCLIVFDSDEQTRSSAIISGNRLSSRTERPELWPTAFISLVDRVAVTGNLIVNESEQPRDKKNLPSLSLMVLPNGPVPPIQEKMPSVILLAAITGNVLKGDILIPPKVIPSDSNAFNDWVNFNSVSP